ncbi:ShlB/FhaC/HecB family hemolysin secretion/activation protein [Pseudomonas aeruginosa]
MGWAWTGTARWAWPTSSTSRQPRRGDRPLAPFRQPEPVLQPALQGWWTFTYGYSQSDYRTRNEASGFPSSDGEAAAPVPRRTRAASRRCEEDRHEPGAQPQRTSNYVEDTRLEDQSTRITETQLGFNHGRRIGGGFVNLDLGWQQGIGALGAQGPGHPQAGDPNRATTSTA